MMLPVFATLPLLFTTTAASAYCAPAACPQDEDFGALLLERSQKAADISLADVWREVRTINAMVDDEQGASFDAAIDSLLKKGAAIPGRGRLLLASLRLYGEDIDYELLLGALQPLLDGDDNQAALGAADLLGDSSMRALLGDDLREGLADKLLEVAMSGDSDPRLRVECAVAAFRVGRSEHVTAGRRVLTQFRDSADPELTTQGVLALARLGMIESVEEQLFELSLLPGPDGRLADALIDKERLRRVMNKQLSRAQNQRPLGTGTELDKDFAKFEVLIRVVQRYHLEGEHVTREELIDAGLDGMLRSLDRHSAYFNSDVYKRFEQNLEAEYGGIGAYVGEDPNDGLFTITRPIYSGPAYRAGLTTDDKIVRIGDWPTIGKETDDIIKRLKGKPKSSVKLYVWRRGMDTELIDRPTEDMAVTLERAQIVIPPVQSEMLPGKIGLLELTTFSRVASAELGRRLIELSEQGMRGLVLDLRNNTGGLLDEAVNVSDLFLGKNITVVSTEDRIGGGDEFKTRRGSFIPDDMPIVVLINRFTASAAEIVSGALQDHRRAVLIGQRSFGKGSVQNLIRLPGQEDDRFEDENGNRRYDNWESITKDFDGDGEFDYAPRLKLTVQRYLLPSGRSIHRELDDEGNISSAGGISPDVEVRARKWEQWRLQEILRLRSDGSVRSWARENFDANRELFASLATGDDDDTSRYPGFDKFYEGLVTVLPKQDVRFLMRREVKRLVQDLRGEAFPLGDYQEDPQLQEAIRHLYADLKVDIEETQAYAKTFEALPSDGDERVLPITVAQAGLEDEQLTEALALIATARDAGGRFSDESLRQLEQLFETLKKN